MLAKKYLINQYHSLIVTGFYNKLVKAAEAHGLPKEYVFAIASRETNCLNKLGDYRNKEYNGVGILQIDIQHDIAKKARDDGTWKTHPEPLIEFGVSLLDWNIERAKKRFPTFFYEQWLKIAASGYNCGIYRAMTAAGQGDSDAFTTGKNYGKDVLQRMKLFKAIIAEDLF
jgi:hypothetical protein